MIPAKKSIYIVVLNWNGAEDTLECLKSLQSVKYDNYNIIVVDNGSTDESVSLIKSQYPQLILIETGENLGFAEGNNVGIRHALSEGADYILILNNDTTVDPEILNHLVAAANENGDAGLIGPKIYYHAQPNVIWSAGGYWDDKNKCFEQTGDGEIDTGQYDKQTTSDFIVGCAMFVPAKVFEQVGLLDPDYFLNYEETDFQYRIRAAGYTTLYEPRAHIWHKVAASFGGDSTPLKYYFIFRNRLLWARRHLKWRDRIPVFWSVHYGLFNQFFRPIIKHIKEKPTVRDAYWAFSSSFSNPLIKARALGTIDYWKNNLGNCPSTILSLNREWIKRQQH